MSEESLNPINELKRLNQYDASIPRRIVHSADSDPSPKLKVRKGWFTAVAHWMDNAIEEGEITDPQLVAEINKFFDFISSPDFSGPRPTKPEEIEMATRLIDKITNTSGSDVIA